MGLRFPFQNYGACFFVTSTFKDWRQLGHKEGFFEALAGSLQFCLGKYEAKMLGYVLMPSHIHLVLLIRGAQLSNFMRGFKKYVAQKIAADLKLGRGGLWMPRFDRLAIYSDKVLRTKLNYMHFNPVKNQLVAKPEDWTWSSAGDYILDRKGPMPIFKDWA